MTIKVCHLTSIHPALDTRIYFKECKSLAQAGYHVVLIAATGKPSTVSSAGVVPSHGADNVVDTVDSPDENRITIIPFPRYKNRLKRILLSPLKMYSMARKEKADVYHFHDPELLITGILLKWFTRARVIYDIHEDYAKTLLDKEWIKFKFLRKLTSTIFYFFERWASRCMSANIVVLPHWMDKFPRAVLVRNYPFWESEARNSENRDEKAFVYVGTIGSKRCAIEMIRIFLELHQLIPGIRFRIIGNFFEKTIKAEVLDYVRRFPVIEYPGYLPFPEARKVLVRSRYGFVLYAGSKYQENISVKMYEYLANGVIPIFSSFEDFKCDIEREGWGIGVNPREPIKAAQAIYSIISDGEKLNVLEENLKKYRAKYNWESEKEELLGLYKRLVGSR
jgi:glycosyltransferase involved in cell wall biosynthesis